jgi:hypothetical protein
MIYSYERFPKEIEVEINHVWGQSNRLDKPLARCFLRWTTQGLCFDIQACYFQSDPPTAPIGPLWKLWEWEVVELFIVGQEQHYLELEFSPHGHYLVLKLHTIRNIIQSLISLEYQSSLFPSSQFYYSSINHHFMKKSQWYGQAIIPFNLLPPPYINTTEEYDYHINMFMCYQHNNKKQYAFAYPLEGKQPNFHQIQKYPSWRHLSQNGSLIK